MVHVFPKVTLFVQRKLPNVRKKCDIWEASLKPSTMSDSRKQKQSSARPQTDKSSDGFVRPSTSGSTGTFSRPSTATGSGADDGSVVSVVTNSRPKASCDSGADKSSDGGTGTNSRPTGRVDHPTGKAQYLEDGEKEPATVVADNSDVLVEYTLKVVSAGPNANKVADLVLGTGRRKRNVNLDKPFSCTMQAAKAAEAFEKARKAVDLGAKVEFTKRITIDVKII
jgi:hypothetical protein